MDKMLTKADVCELLQISASTLSRLVASEELAAFKIGGQLRFYERDVSAYVKAARIRKPKKPAPAAPPRKTVKIGRSVYDASEPFRYVPGMKVV